MPQNAVRAVAPAAGARRLSVKFINPMVIMVGRYDIILLFMLWPVACGIHTGGRDDICSFVFSTDNTS